MSSDRGQPNGELTLPSNSEPSNNSSFSSRDPRANVSQPQSNLLDMLQNFLKNAANEMEGPERPGGQVLTQKQWRAPSQLADAIGATSRLLQPVEQQQVLEALDVKKRLELVEGFSSHLAVLELRSLFRPLAEGDPLSRPLGRS